MPFIDRTVLRRIGGKFPRIAIALAILFIGGIFWHMHISNNEELKRKIGQMILIGFLGAEAPESSDISTIIKDVKIGGVILSDYGASSDISFGNIRNPEQTKKLVSDLQRYSTYPLFVAIDAEGGRVNRLRQEYGFLPILEPEEMGRDETLEITRRESTKLATELKDLGFNMNFAPVVDVNINPENPAIGALGRSFSSDPEKVVDHAKIFIRNHLQNGIITVEKHFPGQGSATEDSHLGITDVTDTYAEAELIPYRKLNEQGLLNAVMTAHIRNRNIDNEYPATLSRAFLQDILRKRIGFKGIIISDDMQMAAIGNNYTLDEAVIAAINAGVDMITSLNNFNVDSGEYDRKMAYTIRDIIFNAVQDGKIKEERITESHDRILNMKKRFKIR